MIVNDDARRPEAKAQKPTAGWTSLHSWIFLAIVAIGLMTIGIQNRYHYLSPLGLGKAYRIDKLFGGIQEFNPNGGWITAQLQVPGIPPTMQMVPPQPSGSPSIPMNMSSGGIAPAGIPPTGGAVAPKPVVEKEEVTTSVAVEDIPAEKPSPDKPSAESPSEEVSPPEVAATQPTTPELTDEDKLAAFNKQFPEFGKDEFQLANDDLYPDWKKEVKPNGTWQQFLVVYGDFITWWTDSGSPAESGFTLWKKFLTKETQ